MCEATAIEEVASSGFGFVVQILRQKTVQGGVRQEGLAAR